jgi:predicted TIM-barrel fold metal-dependent hydrolase
VPRQIIDIHPHVISADDDRYPKNPLGGTQSGWSRQRPVTTGELIAAMDRGGVAKAAVVQASTAYGHDNSYLADSVDAHRDRLTGVVSVDLLAPDAIGRLRYWIDERGLSGLRLFTTGSTMPAQGTWLDAPEAFPAWEWASEHGIPICVQMRMEGIPLLRGMLTRFPRARIILDHLARVPIEEGPPYAGCQPVFDLADHETVFLKLTSRSILESRTGAATPDTFFPELLKRFGSHRIAWGSNYPASVGSLPDLVALAQETLGVVSDADADWIFAGTARKLYPVLGEAKSPGLRSA